jgi:predicted  nucleic acid-binding Zn-ribbon protein
VPSQAEVRAARKEIARIERRLQRIAEAEERLHARMAEVATDHAAVTALDTEVRGLAAEREQLEEEWLAAAEVAG